MNRSRCPTATGSPPRPRTHFSSHWTSCGQTLPARAGRSLSRYSSAAAWANRPWATKSRNSGIRTATGQPETQGAFLHWRQRRASSMAACSTRPRLTSWKSLLRTSPGRCGIPCRGMAIRSLAVSLLVGEVIFQSAFRVSRQWSIASASCPRYIANRSASSSKSTRWPSNSGPSTQAN